MRTERFGNGKIYLFPFDRIDEGEEVVIYGAGSVGAQYLLQINKLGCNRVKYVVDRRWESLNTTGGKTFGNVVYKPLETLRQETNIKVIIAIESGSIAAEISKKCQEMGIEKTDIIWDIRAIPYINVEDDSEIKTLCRREYLSGGEAEERYGRDYSRYLTELTELLSPWHLKGKKVRIGNVNDGGYVMADCFEGKAAYSFGIANDVSWDNEMAEHGYNVYMYDPTINSIPFERKEFHFFKKGIADRRPYTDDYATLEELLNENGHNETKGMVLKMDVEGAEYGFLKMTDLSTLKQFDQIALELHNICSPENAESVICFLKKMSETHYLIHIHGNNYTDALYVDGKCYPDAIELSYVNKNNYEVERRENYSFVYSEYDAPNWRDVPDF